MSLLALYISLHHIPTISRERHLRRVLRKRCSPIKVRPANIERLPPKHLTSQIRRKANGLDRGGSTATAAAATAAAATPSSTAGGQIRPYHPSAPLPTCRCIGKGLTQIRLNPARALSEQRKLAENKSVNQTFFYAQCKFTASNHGKKKKTPLQIL